MLNLLRENCCFHQKNKKNKTERGREGEGRDEGGKVT